MKVLPFKIPKPSNTAILFQVDHGVLYQKLHQHEEVQTSLIKEGAGTLLAGDTIHPFAMGDVIILGSRQPHVFRSSEISAVMHTVFFSRDAFGDVFLELDEGRGIEKFYAFAKAGLKTRTTPAITSIFQQLHTAKGVYKLAHFIDLITVLRNCNVTPLSSFIYEKAYTERDGKRMQAVIEYALAHFTTSVQLESVAKVAAMTPNAFCKFFKQRTNKTYFQFITELRIERACSLLKEHADLPVREIAEQCGFPTLSHFNKKFKSSKKTTPSVYKQSQQLV